jgi:hypothetical protein
MTPLSVGNVLGRTFSIWAKNFVPFTVLAAIVYSPMLIALLVLISGQPTLRGLTTFLGALSLFSLILSIPATAAIIYGVFQELHGQRVSLGQSVSVGLRRLLPVLGTSLLVGLCVTGGFILLVIPGFILMCMLWLAVPVAVVEGQGGTGALGRSRSLTEGVKGTIFGILFVIGAINYLASFILQKAFLGSGAASMGSIKLYLVLVTVLSMLALTLNAVANAVAYHDIREAKEGVHIDELIAVFE